MEIDLEHSHLLIAQFAERATPLGSVVERAADSAEAAGIIASLVKQAGTDAISAAPVVAERAPQLVAALTYAGIEVQTIGSPEDARDRPVGLSLASRAIAETGSALLDERQLADRAASLMTLHSIVLVAASDIIPSLDSTPALLREIAGRPGGGYASFVTGPSRTADIEMSLTVGVQGPGQVTILFVDSLT
ncbi:MAG TPA: LUD domain-containing protein [Thermomicrobiales bacterium]|jgi:L-lactate dehydrogenase complex protein LldG|nr:LUD domain-containing protein [Thermomicrobiales bacterium]